MSYEYSEDALIENATEEVLIELGWKVVTAWKSETFGTDGLLGRDNKSEVVLERHLTAALKKYNLELPELAYTRAVEKIVQREADKSIAQQNKSKYLLFKNGVEVSFVNEQGKSQKKTLKVFDFKDYTNNDFLAVRQLEVNGDLYNRRPDVIGFVNGIPLVFMELKSHANDLRSAYDDNFKDYKDTIPHLFYHNAFVILSNGTAAKVGTITSPYKYFLDWKRITEDADGVVELDTMLRGTCSPKNLMDIFENFLLFDDSNGKIVKLMAKNHQFIGVNRVLENVLNIEDLEGKLGVYWHTQGSGKTYSMVFLCEKIHRKFGGSYTFLIVVDRTELENQAYDTFSGVGVVRNKNVIAGKKKGISGRDHLRELLSENHRYVFSLIHKFSIDPKLETEYPLITDRKNIIVISDEAHRTQGGKYAGNMRFYGLPNASYLGFTGTPIIKDEEEVTKNIFGEYVSVYDFKRAIEDEATLPLKYLNRGERLNIDNPVLDEQMAEIMEEENLDEDQKKKLAYLFQKEYPILTAESRLRAIAKDLVWHFNERGYQGKAMLVALDKTTAVRMYDYIMEYWSVYLSELQQRISKSIDSQEEQELQRKYNQTVATEICVVISSEQNEIDNFKRKGLDIEQHRRKMVERDLEKQFKDENHSFRLAIVCAMWITGFDAPCVSTVYLDKPIKGHTLMQTIARANRVYDDEKENGLIVDYGNVYQQLEKAYAIYGEGVKSDEGGKGKEKKPLELLISMAEEIQKAIDEVVVLLRDEGFELDTLMNTTAMGKIAAVKNGSNAVCRNEESRAKFEIAARNVFRKYKALFPEKQAKKFTKSYNAIDAIYNELNQKVKSADISEIIMQLQKVVNNSIFINELGEQLNVIIDLSNLNVDALRKAFEKIQHKNELVFDLNKAVEQKLEQMLQQNPLRMEFYDRYQEIVEEYNNGKTEAELTRSFDNLTAFVMTLSQEEKRSIHESLDEPTLSIFDLLIQNKELNKDERAEVKKLAKETLEVLKREKLNIPNWKESRELKAGIKMFIYDKMLNLPESKYTDEEVSMKSNAVYQHLYSYASL